MEGKVVLYSKRTAVVNPGMILNEYLRIITKRHEDLKVVKSLFLRGIQFVSDEAYVDTYNPSLKHGRSAGLTFSLIRDHSIQMNVEEKQGEMKIRQGKAKLVTPITPKMLMELYENSINLVKSALKIEESILEAEEEYVEFKKKYVH